MKKIISVLLALVLVFASVGCSQTEERSDIEKAEQLIRQGDYEEVIEDLEAMIDKDELNIEAWDLIAEAYIKAQDYDKADEWLEQYLELVDDNIDNKDFNKVKAIDSIGDYGRDILREGEFVSSWYDTIVPESFNSDDLDYEYEIGTLLELEVPKGTDLYFSFDGNPREDGTKYEDGILLDGEGYTYIDFVTVNKYGEYSPIISTYFNVYASYSEDYDYDDTEGDIDDSISSVDLVLPQVDLEPGTYTEYKDLRITNYDEGNSDLTITYTTNGSDPREYSSSVRYYYDAIPLTAGAYEIAVAVYDYNTDEYSDVAYFDYYIDHPDMVTLGLYMLPEAAVEAYKVMFDEAGWYDIYVEPIVYENLIIEDMDLENLPEVVITYGTFAEDLNEYGMVANIEDYFNLADYDFIGQADNIGAINGVKYMMPLTIRPEFMVYGDYEGAGLIDWEYLQGESEWYSEQFAFAGDSPEFFLGIYYGLGGPVLDATASNLDKTIVIEALNMIQSMPEAGLGSKLYTSDELLDGLDNYDFAYFLMGGYIEESPDYYFSQVGQMPLSNGEFAKYYNVATGLFISNLAVTLDPSLQDRILDMYTYMTQESYYISSIASAEGSIPANRAQAVDYEWYLDGSLDDYISMIDNGISSIRRYSLYSVYDALTLPLEDFVNGASPEEVAESIMLNLSNSSN